MAPRLLKPAPDDFASLDFWQLRAIYVQLVLGGTRSAVEKGRLARVTRRLDEIYGRDWRSGAEPTYH